MDIKNVTLSNTDTPYQQVINNESTQNSSTSINVYEANFDKYNIVPLGCECIARDLFAYKNNVMQSSTLNKVAPKSPFDSCVHADVDGIIHTLDTDFKEYFDDLGTIDVNQDPRLTVNFRKDYPTRTEMFYNKTLKAAYVHEDCGDRDVFIKRHMCLIDKMRETLNSGKHLFFVIACLGHTRKHDGTLLDKNHCLITSEQIKRLSAVLDKICNKMHSLIVFAPGANIASDRKDVLILKEHFGSQRYWSMIRYQDKNIKTPFSPTFDKISQFFENRLKDTELSERTVKVDNLDKNSTEK